MKKLVLILLLISFPAFGAETSGCSDKTEGMLKCVESRLCVCANMPGGTITGNKRGYRWDCGLDRPACATDTKIETETKKYDGPNSVNIDKSSVNVTH